MTTAGALIDQAFLWLGVRASEETMSAAEGVDALATLNGMLHGFPPKGIAYAHRTLAAADTVNVPDEQLRNVMLMLAAELAPEYEVELSTARAEMVDQARRALQAAYYLPREAAIEPLLRPHLVGRFNMRNPG